MNNFFLPRGIRNCNPGNIRLGKTRWQGQKPVQTDMSFVEFAEAVMGLRALMKTLITYHLKYQLDTVESIINRWAPPHENATDDYIHHVAKKLGVKRRDKINVIAPAVLMTLAQSIVRHENGPPPKAMPPLWYDEATYKDAAHLALQDLISV